MSEMPMSPSPMASDVNDNDKLMALLSYLFTPLVPIIVLVSETMKARPYQKYHAQQALGLLAAELLLSIVACIVFFVCTIVSAGILGLCLWILFFLPFIPQVYYALIAYTQARYFEIPVITDFMRQQGWLNVPASTPPPTPPPTTAPPGDEMPPSG